MPCLPLLAHTKQGRRRVHRRVAAAREVTPARTLDPQNRGAEISGLASGEGRRKRLFEGHNGNAGTGSLRDG